MYNIIKIDMPVKY